MPIPRYISALKSYLYRLRDEIENNAPDLKIIQKWIEPKSRVLDLGCGDGALLTLLQRNKRVDSIGLEIDAAKIQHCIQNGVNVIEQNLDKGLSILKLTVLIRSANTKLQA